MLGCVLEFNVIMVTTGLILIDTEYHTYFLITISIFLGILYQLTTYISISAKPGNK